MELSAFHSHTGLMTSICDITARSFSAGHTPSRQMRVNAEYVQLRTRSRTSRQNILHVCPEERTRSSHPQQRSATGCEVSQQDVLLCSSLLPVLNVGKMTSASGGAGSARLGSHRPSVASCSLTEALSRLTFLQP